MLRMDPSPTLAAHFFVFLKHGVRQTDYVLALPVSEQLQGRAPRFDGIRSPRVAASVASTHLGEIEWNLLTYS